MKPIVVQLETLLASRETRVEYQQQLLSRYQLPLVSFMLNIPGSIKYCAEACYIHATGCTAFAAMNYSVLHAEIRHLDTGIEAYFAVDAEALAVKKACCHLEENHILGRLFDFDVITPDRGTISRQQCGFAVRSCMVCGADVLVCRRTRAHAMSELWAYIHDRMRVSGYRGI